MVKLLSHPAWQGVGAIFSGVGTFLAAVTIFLTIYPITPPTSPSPPIVIPLPSASVSPPPDNPPHDVNDIIRYSLENIRPGYRGEHTYPDERLPIAVLAIVFLVFGSGFLVLHRQAKART